MLCAKTGKGEDFLLKVSRNNHLLPSCLHRLPCPGDSGLYPVLIISHSDCTTSCNAMWVLVYAVQPLAQRNKLMDCKKHGFRSIRSLTRVTLTTGLVINTQQLVTYSTSCDKVSRDIFSRAIILGV